MISWTNKKTSKNFSNRLSPLSSSNLRSEKGVNPALYFTILYENHKYFIKQYKFENSDIIFALYKVMIFDIT